MPAPTDAPMKPLIFGPRSILAWQQHAKTQTRRLVRPQKSDGWYPQNAGGLWLWLRIWEGGFEREEVERQPYAVGDLLWIREALLRFREPPDMGDGSLVVYEAGGNFAPPGGPEHEWSWQRDKLPWSWQRDKLPAMFMPRWACRYYARVVSVRAERLQKISVFDALNEGALVGQQHVPGFQGGERVLYLEWWDSMHKKPGTRSEDNPWVWVYGLEAADANEG